MCVCVCVCVCERERERERESRGGGGKGWGEGGGFLVHFTLVRTLHRHRYEERLDSWRRCALGKVTILYKVMTLIYAHNDDDVRHPA